MKFRYLLVLAFLLFVVTGCSRAPSEAPHASATTTSGDASRARVVTAEISITVETVDDAMSKLRDEVERSGGWIADANVFGEPSERAAHLDVRVPAKDLKKLRVALAKLGEVTSDSEHVTDVTETRADLDARLHNARVQEKRILEIIAARPGTLADLLEAEKELSRVRENVERLEAQRNALGTQIEFATVRLSLATRTTPAWQTPGASLKHAASSGLRGGAAVVVYGAMAVATVAPTLLPIVIVIAGIVLVVRRKRRLPQFVQAG
jgi:hypothetical protein